MIQLDVDWVGTSSTPCDGSGVVLRSPHVVVVVVVVVMDIFCRLSVDGCLRERRVAIASPLPA